MEIWNWKLRFEISESENLQFKNSELENSKFKNSEFETSKSTERLQKAATAAVKKEHEESAQ